MELIGQYKKLVGEPPETVDYIVFTKETLVDIINFITKYGTLCEINTVDLRYIITFTNRPNYNGRKLKIEEDEVIACGQDEHSPLYITTKERVKFILEENELAEAKRPKDWMNKRLLDYCREHISTKDLNIYLQHRLVNQVESLQKIVTVYRNEESRDNYQ